MYFTNIVSSADNEVTKQKGRKLAHQPARIIRTKRHPREACQSPGLSFCNGPPRSGLDPGSHHAPRNGAGTHQTHFLSIYNLQLVTGTEKRV